MAFQRKRSFTCVQIEKCNLIYIFLKEENQATTITFKDEVFLTQLAHLCDIFSKLHQLNISLQGKETYLLQRHDKITTLKENYSCGKLIC